MEQGTLTSAAFNLDCIDGLSTLPNNCIDLTVTSPPYDGLRTYGGYEFNWMTTIKELYRVTKDGGVVVWVVNDQTKNGSETGTSFRQTLHAMDCGFKLHDTMIWEKDTCAFPDSSRYYPVFEYMFVWAKGRPKTFNPIKDRPNKYAGTRIHGTYRDADGMLHARSGKWSESICGETGCRFNIWKINTEKNNHTGHPAVFPYQLAYDHIRTWSNEGDMVLDPFLGSGTTRMAAYDLRRDFLGYEISEMYYSEEEKRFAEYIRDTKGVVSDG